LAGSTAYPGAGGASRAEQYANLLKLCESGLERRFLRYLYDGGFRLPDEGQKSIRDARPDFFYEESQACVYVDGPIHEFPDRAVRDKGIRDDLTRFGCTVVTVQDEQSWAAVLDEYPWVIGAGRES
jgi:hypothetical protein